MFSRIAAEFICVQAERKFKAVVRDICQGLTAEDLRQLAEHNIPLSRVMAELGYKVERPQELHPAVQYLLALPQDRILGLIQQVAPSHATVLREYPEFAATVLDSFRELVT